VATLGASAFLFLLSLAVNTQIRRGVDYPKPPGVPEFAIGNLNVTSSYGAMLIFTPLVVAAIALFLARSRYGIAIRAAASNRDAAVMAGISAGRMSSLAWALAGAVSAYTAILQFPQKGFMVTGASLGPGLLTRALVASVLARFTSLPVALAGGVGVGVLEQLMLWNSPSAGAVEFVLFAVVLGALLLQTRQSARESEQGSWLALQSWDPLPERLARVWVIRNLGVLSAVVVAVLLALVSLTTGRASLIFTVVIAYTLVGLSVHVVTGLGGQLSLGQFALAGVGAAGSYHLFQNGAPFLVALFGGGLAAAAFSAVIGVPSVRIRGLLLAVTTLSFAVMSEAWLFQQSWFMGGGVSPGKPHGFGTAREYYLVTIPVLLAALWCGRNVRRGGFGRSLMAVRDNEDGARAFTVRATKLKLQSFVLAGFLAGVGGAVYGHGLSRIGTETFRAGESITVLAMSVLGGLSLLPGAFVGALYLIAFPQFVPLDSAGLAASTLGWLLLILYFPGGLAQMAKPVRDRVIAALARRAGIDPDAEDGTGVDAGDLPEAAVERKLPVAVGRPHREGALRHELLLDVQGVGRRFGGVVAVDEVTLGVRRGETIGIIGPNGAGKTTLFEVIAGFTRADRGRVVFDYTDVTGYSPEDRAMLGLVRSFQDARLFPTLTVLDCVRLAQERSSPTPFFSSVLGLRSATAAERRKDELAREMVEVMGLSSYRNKRINELSTGTRRITELACVSVLEPKLLLLDEPSSGIAQRETEALGELLERLKVLLDTTYIVIEHDMPLIMGISDRIVAMESGRVIAEGPPDVVRSDPRVVESYLGGDIRAIERSGTAEPASSNGPAAATATARRG
jgi:ABC-type branched-subunit amino acid transport system ATPase component/ABC-type branched-subunit amino acid transport system permease subunit